jgi:predicted nucleic acid-binding Zn ribbon protein
VHKHERRGPSPIKFAIRDFLKQSGLGERPRDMLVFGAWSEAVGPDLARRAVPVRFRNGELTVEVESAVHLQELKNFTAEQYRREANAKLGREIIRELAFKLRG